MKLVPLLLAVCLAGSSLGTSPVPTPTKKHKAIDGLLPLNKGPGAKPTPPPPTTEHEIDRRFPKQVRSRQSLMTFPGDDRVDEDPRPCPQPYPLDGLFALNGQRDPQAAKDAGVFYLSEPGDATSPRQLFYQAAAVQKPKALTHLPEGVAYFQVSPDGKKVLAATAGATRTTLYLIDPVRPTETRLLSEQFIPSAVWSSDSTWFAYTSNLRNGRDLDLYRFPIGSGRGMRLADLSGYHLVTDISPDGQAIALTAVHSATESDVVVWTRSGTTVVSGAGNVQAYAAKFTRDSQSLLALTDAGRGTPQLTLVPRSPSLKAKLLTSENGPVDGFALDDARSMLIFRVNEDGYSSLHGWVIDKRGSHNALLTMPKFPGVVTSLPSFTQGSGFFYSRTSPSRPWAIWRWSHPYHEVWQPASTLTVPRRCFIVEKRVHYPSFDGKSIPGFLYAPSNASSNPGYVVIAHDGPDAQARPVFDSAVQYLALRGYGVFTPDVRGSTGYGRDFTDADNRRNRLDAVKDLVAGGKWLLDSRQARPGRVAALGGGYGGFLVVRALPLAGDIFRAGAAVGGWLNLASLVSAEPPFWKAYEEAEFGTTGDLEFLRTLSPVAETAPYKARLLLLAAATGPLTPLADVEQVLRQTKAAGVSSERKPYSSQGDFRGFGNADLGAVSYFFDDSWK